MNELIYGESLVPLSNGSYEYSYFVKKPTTQNWVKVRRFYSNYASIDPAIRQKIAEPQLGNRFDMEKLRYAGRWNSKVFDSVNVMRMLYFTNKAFYDPIFSEMEKIARKAATEMLRYSHRAKSFIVGEMFIQWKIPTDSLIAWEWSLSYEDRVQLIRNVDHVAA